MSHCYAVEVFAFLKTLKLNIAKMYWLPTCGIKSRTTFTSSGLFLYTMCAFDLFTRPFLDLHVFTLLLLRQFL